jgi:hypothetical protein
MQYGMDGRHEAAARERQVQDDQRRRQALCAFPQRLKVGHDVNGLEGRFEQASNTLGKPQVTVGRRRYPSHLSYNYLMRRQKGGRVHLL